jgi:hypothetical protein
LRQWGYSPIAIVHGVAKPGRVDDGESEIHPVLFQQHFARLHGNGLLHPQAGARMLRAIDVREEERIYHGGFAEARLACGN